MALVAARGGEPVPATKDANPDAAAKEAKETAAKETVRAANRQALDKASDLARAGKHDVAEQVIEETLVRLGPADPFVEELQGTVLALERKFPEAEASFRAMLKKSPDSPVGHFNLAEMMLMQHQYAEAEHEYAALETARRAHFDPAMADACRFKRTVCLIAAGDVPAAERLLPPPDPIPSPSVRYSRAAVLYAKGDFRGANGEIEHARQDFAPTVESFFTDSFVEFGWGAPDAAGVFRLKER
jgi:tetratricopeptide (TPR) repeat protein